MKTDDPRKLTGDSLLDGKREDELVIGKMSYSQEMLLCSKNLITWQNYNNFWRPALDKGLKCWRYVMGDVLSDDEKSDLKLKQKLIIQVAELVPKMNALIGMQIQQAKPGRVIGEEGTDAPDAAVADRMLKIIERENEANIEYSDCYKDAMVTSFPSVLFFDRSMNDMQEQRLDMWHDPWDSFLPDPNFKRYDLKDASTLIRVRSITTEKLIQMWPHRANEIMRKMPDNRETYDSWSSALYTSEDRDTLFSSTIVANEFYARTGLIYVIERLHYIHKETKVYLSENSSTPQILPPDWTPEEIEKWKQENPDFKAVLLDVDLLWVTTCTSNNVLLENGPHWFQNSEWPCEIFVPQFMNNKPTGLVEFLLDNLKLGIFADIEQIQSIRLSNDNLMIVKEGVLVNAEDAASEKARAGGMLVLGEDADMEDISFPQNRRENAAYRELKLQTLDTNDRMSVERAFQGGLSTSQQSGKSIEAQVKQTENKYSPYINNFNAFLIRCRKKILKMIPSVYTEEHVWRYINEDDGGKTQEEFTTNSPQYNLAGDITKFYNNLDGAVFDYIATFGDDSISGKMQELNDFIEIFRTSLPSMPQESWAQLLISMPNRLAQEFGKKLMEQEQAAAEKGPERDPMSISLSLTGDDLLYSPAAKAVLAQEGIEIPEGTLTNPQKPQAEEQNIPQEQQII
jgi:hypothetical protein